MVDRYVNSQPSPLSTAPPPETVVVRLTGAFDALGECHKIVSEIESAVGAEVPSIDAENAPVAAGIHGMTMMVRSSAAEMRTRLMGILNSLR